MRNFLTIRETAKSGLISENLLRQLVAQGRCPCIRSGSRVYVNVPLLTEQLDRESREAVNANADDGR